MLEKKASILLTLRILRELTDKDHFLTQQQIAEEMTKKYGVTVERKTVSDNIKMLVELDYDIIKGRGNSGYALIDRDFNASQIKYLADAIYSSKFISSNSAKELVEKLASKLSIYERVPLNDFALSTGDIFRTENDEIFLNIEVIEEAIQKNKWVSFKYLYYDKDGKPVERFDGYTYNVSPCYLVNNFGSYYLLGKKSNHDEIAIYRLDMISNISILENRERIDPSTLKDFNGYNNIAEYINDHVYLFGGKAITALVEVENPQVITYIKMWFGKNSEAVADEEGHRLLVKIRCNENALFFWLLQYGQFMKVLQPLSLKEKIRDSALDIFNKYK